MRVMIPITLVSMTEYVSNKNHLAIAEKQVDISIGCQVKNTKKAIVTNKLDCTLCKVWEGKQKD